MAEIAQVSRCKSGPKPPYSSTKPSVKLLEQASVKLVKMALEFYQTHLLMFSSTK